MKTTLNNFLKPISSLSKRKEGNNPDESLFMWRDGSLACYYAPFEFINKNAKVVIVGLTPGKTQMNIALNALMDEMKKDDENIDLCGIKKSASFSGDMRKHLVDILNRIELPKRIGVHDLNDLWGKSNDLVHFCSLIRYPIFEITKDKNGEEKYSNYTGNSKPPLDSREIEKMVLDYFINDLQLIDNNAEIILLGTVVTDAVTQLYNKGLISHKLTKSDDGQIIGLSIHTQRIENQDGMRLKK